MKINTEGAVNFELLELCVESFFVKGMHPVKTVLWMLCCQSWIVVAELFGLQRLNKYATSAP